MRLVRFASLFAFLAACSNASYGEDTGDAGAGGDSGPTTPDSSTSGADASTDGMIADGGGPSITNGGFEDPGTACGPTWELINATAVRSSTHARSGASACLVCNIAGDGYFGLRAVPEPKGGPGVWSVEAYFSNVPDREESPAEEAHLDFGWSSPDGGGSESPIVSLSAYYKPLQVVKQLGDDVSGPIGIQVAATGSKGSCFLVDDVTLNVVPR